MWPCNSIIIAFVWFVTHGKWTQAFHCGFCLRLVIHAGFKVTPYYWMESQREGVSSSQRVSKTQVLCWTWGQWWCPWRAPGHPAQDSEGTAPEPRSVCWEREAAAPSSCAHSWATLLPSVKKIPRPWQQQWPGMCLHSPEEEKWHHLEHGPAFLIVLNSLPSSPGDSRGVSVLLLLTTPTPAAVRLELEKHTQTNRRLFHSKTKNVMNFYSC